MFQQLRVPAALSEDVSSVQFPASTFESLHLHITSTPGSLMPPSGLLRYLHTDGIYSHRSTHIHIYKNKS